MHFFYREHYSVGHVRSFAEEDRGLDLQDPSSCASALMNFVIT